ncbi:RNA polymerase sigma factor, sigma-70 family [Spirosomataceae bacterium TFI 002]|nr:RNA polymerase sigma factor, sigma-70 family [Spirosomataceae bacterium TFI 002]
MTIEERIQSGDNTVVKTLYEDSKQPFLRFASRFSVQQADIEDIYQDAIVALIENIRKGKVSTLKSSIGTYLFAIGKLMIFQKLKKGSKTEARSEFDSLGLVWEEFDDDAEMEKSALLNSSLSKLGDQCKKLLTMFYYDNKKLDSISTEMGYESKDVTKSQKSRCLKKLKELMKA